MVVRRAAILGMLSVLGAIAVLISLLGAGTTSRAQLRASVRVSELNIDVIKRSFRWLTR